ncbi:hypothetical protein M0R45_030443 [Rubus argutus]|uniref:Uncharacterized protein n=1 Tax=Rubus argutus TaxID=59490 RepID=A0AAW1WDJ4_RUBAR
MMPRTHRCWSCVAQQHKLAATPTKALSDQTQPNKLGLDAKPAKLPSKPAPPSQAGELSIFGLLLYIYFSVNGLPYPITSHPYNHSQIPIHLRRTEMRTRIKNRCAALLTDVRRQCGGLNWLAGVGRPSL